MLWKAALWDTKEKENQYQDDVRNHFVFKTASFVFQNRSGRWDAKDNDGFSKL